MGENRDTNKNKEQKSAKKRSKALNRPLKGVLNHKDFLEITNPL